MTKCKWDDCGWCYAPDGTDTNAKAGACLHPKICPQTTNKLEPMTETEEGWFDDMMPKANMEGFFKGNKYLREIKPGVMVDVYDVLAAWDVSNPALQHLIKKALQAGNRGHKDLETDMQDIIDSAIRAKELVK